MFHLGDLVFNELGMVTSSDGHVARFPSNDWDETRANYSHRVGAAEPGTVEQPASARARGARETGVLLQSPSKVPVLGLERKKVPTAGTEWWYEEELDSEDRQGKDGKAPGEKWGRAEFGGEENDGTEMQGGGGKTEGDRIGDQRGWEEVRSIREGNEDGWHNSDLGWGNFEPIWGATQMDKDVEMEKAKEAQESETSTREARSASAQNGRDQDLTELSERPERPNASGSVSARSDGDRRIEPGEMSNVTESGDSVGAALAYVTRMVQNDVGESEVTKMQTESETPENQLPARGFGTRPRSARPRPRRVKVTRKRKLSVDSAGSSTSAEDDVTNVCKRKNSGKPHRDASSDEDPEWKPKSGTQAKSDASSEDVSGSGFLRLRGGGTEETEEDEVLPSAPDLSEGLADVIFDAVDDAMEALDEVSKAAGGSGKMTQGIDGEQKKGDSSANARADSGGTGGGIGSADFAPERSPQPAPEAEGATEPMQWDPCDDENHGFDGVPEDPAERTWENGIPAEGVWPDGIPGTWGFPEAGDAVGAAAAQALTEPLAQGVLDAVKRPGGGELDVARRVKASKPFSIVSCNWGTPLTYLDQVEGRDVKKRRKISETRIFLFVPKYRPECSIFDLIPLAPKFFAF